MHHGGAANRAAVLCEGVNERGIATLTIALLAMLGAAIARGVYGNPWVWAPALGAGGVALTALGVWLNIVG